VAQAGRCASLTEQDVTQSSTGTHKPQTQPLCIKNFAVGTSGELRHNLRFECGDAVAGADN
jgi:hypothetical protein